MSDDEARPPLFDNDPYAEEKKRERFLTEFLSHLDPITSIDSIPFKETNEDWAGSKDNVFVVCDGVSSDTNSDLASTKVGEYVLENLAGLSKLNSETDIETGMKKVILDANAIVLRGYPNDSTTIVASIRWLDPDGFWRLTTASIGDSRAYLGDDRTPIEQITLDDGVYELPAEMNVLVKRVESGRNIGELSGDVKRLIVAFKSTLTKFGFEVPENESEIIEMLGEYEVQLKRKVDDIGKFEIQKELAKIDFNQDATLVEPRDKPYLLLAFALRNRISNFVGNSDLVPDQIHVQTSLLNGGDTLVLSTDGVGDQTTESQIADIAGNPFATATELSKAADAVIGTQKKIDDITSLIVRMPSKEPPFFILYDGKRWKVDGVDENGNVQLHRLEPKLKLSEINREFNKVDKTDATIGERILVPIGNLYSGLNLDYPNLEEGVLFLRGILDQRESGAIKAPFVRHYPIHSYHEYGPDVKVVTELPSIGRRQ